MIVYLIVNYNDFTVKKRKFCFKSDRIVRLNRTNYIFILREGFIDERINLILKTNKKVNFLFYSMNFNILH